MGTTSGLVFCSLSPARLLKDGSQKKVTFKHMLFAFIPMSELKSRAYFWHTLAK
jgi:hypothetical protein